MSKKTGRCTNTGCVNADKQKKLDSRFGFCPLCGARLTSVCAKCGTALEEGQKLLCPACAEAKQEKQAKTRRAVKAASTGVISAGLIAASVLTGGKEKK